MAGMLRSPEPTTNDGQCPDIFTAEFKGSPGHIRVLKPPGGGSSDIFGGEDGNPPTPRPASKHHLKSSLFAEPPASPAPTTNGNSEPITNGTPNGTTNGHTTPKGNKTEGRNPVTGETYTGDEKDSSSAMQNQPRHRVPPGGYTTPLW